MVRSRLNEPDAVDDVMQNIALAIVKQCHALEEITRIGAWLYQIALRQVLMYRRSAGRHRKMLKRAGGELDAVTSSMVHSPTDHVIAAELQQNVQRALAELSELDRQILLLKYTENWSYRQLAEHLGVREDTVEYRLLKARKNLKQQLCSFMDSDGSTIRDGSKRS